MNNDNGLTKWRDEYLEKLQTSEMKIRCTYYKGCRIEKSSTSHGAPKWLLFMSEEGTNLKDTFTTKEHAMDYVDKLEEEKGKSKEQRKPKAEYKYPLVDRSDFVERSKTVFRNSRVVNVGYAEGILSDERPFRLECWAEDQLTNLTIFISNMGIENYTSQDVLDYLKNEGVFWRLKDARYGSGGSVLLFRENNGNEFWSANLLVGDDLETYLDFVPLKKWD